MKGYDVEHRSTQLTLSLVNIVAGAAMVGALTRK